MYDSTHSSLYRVLTPMAALLFLAGAAGALCCTDASAFSAADRELSQLGHFSQALGRFLLPSLAAYVLSFSALGVLGLPCLLITQGYLQVRYAVTVSSAVFSRMLLEQWLPGLVAVSCTFSMAIPAFLFSLIRFRQVLGKSSGFSASRAHQFGSLLITLSLLSLCALYCTFLVPRLLS